MSNNETTLTARKARVMARVQQIPKNGFNSFHKYAFSSRDDLVEAMRPLLAEEGISLEVKTGQPQWRAGSEKGGPIVTLPVSFILRSGDASEAAEENVFYGEGQDGGDKAIYKAYSGAEKYFYRVVFAVSTGDNDDPEFDGGKSSATSTAKKNVTAAKEILGAADEPTIPFGPTKGEPISKATERTLKFHVDAAKKSIADPDKAKFKAQNEKLLAAMEAELKRRAS